jgi:hypothetical protein
VERDERAGSLHDAHEARSFAHVEDQPIRAGERHELRRLTGAFGELLKDWRGKLAEPQRTECADAETKQLAARLEVVAAPREQSLLAERHQDAQRRRPRHLEAPRDLRRRERLLGIDEELERFAGFRETRYAVLAH